MKRKKKVGRPELSEKDRKIGISTKLHPSIVERADKRAAAENRSRNNVIESVLDKNL